MFKKAQLNVKYIYIYIILYLLSMYMYYNIVILLTDFFISTQD